MSAFPFLTAYDPPGSSEGTLDPLGLYQVADQLAVRLVPAVRERMQRVRFLTAIAVGSIVTEGLEADASQRDAEPYLVWEWLVVEGLVRKMGGDPDNWAVAGSQLARRAIDQYGYLDARSYLKTPRIFGFNGIYKRLAVHLGLVDVHLLRGVNADALADAWARGIGRVNLADAKPIFDKWRAAIRRSLDERPPRTKPGWSDAGWAELAEAFAPGGAKTREKRVLRDLLHSPDGRRLGALPEIWALQGEFKNGEYGEERLHVRLEKVAPEYAPLLNAIRTYEAFARGLQDAFDVLLTDASSLDAHGFSLAGIAKNKSFTKSTERLHERFAAAYRSLGEITITSLSVQNVFSQRFAAFGEPQGALECVRHLCDHHEAVQKAKSFEGKRPWFDRIGQDRIHVRPAYRAAAREIRPERYVHEYRGWPIRRFERDLS